MRKKTGVHEPLHFGGKGKKQFEFVRVKYQFQSII